MSAKRILVAPLDWGLGHATRCVPVIRALLEAGATPVLAADGGPLSLLQQEFPSLEHHRFPGYGITYPKEGRGMAWHFLLQAPGILQRIKQEQQELHKLIVDLSLDGVISDNRFGLYTDQVPCVYMTHQVHIQAPAFGKSLYRMHRKYISRYSQWWLPDDNELQLSGALGHRTPQPENGHRVGLLSRFAEQEQRSTQKHVLAICSGPEPQRSFFEEAIIKQAGFIQQPLIILRGLPAETDLPLVPDGVRVHNHLPTGEFQRLMESASLIICRPGYSTLMDLSVLGKRALLVPTPGQTEQEYLGSELQKKEAALVVSQSELNLYQNFRKALFYPPLQGKAKPDLLRTAIENFLALIT